MTSRIKRIRNEIDDLFKNRLDDNFIYYDIDDENIEILKVLIIGTDKTPYKNGFFFFSVKFSDNYPLTPPKVWFYTTNSKVRMNPNLYNNGKVCLSIINTWGNTDNWTEEMSVRSILLSIQSMVLCDNPLKNEPGLYINKLKNNNYNKVVEYCVCNIAILQNLKESNVNYRFENNYTNNNKIINFNCFKKIIQNHFVNNIHTYVNDIKKLYFTNGNTVVRFTSPYEPTKFKCNYLEILKELVQIYNNITNKQEQLIKLIDDVDLKKLTKVKLINICKNNKIKNYSRLKKNEIIDLIKIKNDIFQIII